MYTGHHMASNATLIPEKRGPPGFSSICRFYRCLTSYSFALDSLNDYRLKAGRFDFD